MAILTPSKTNHLLTSTFLALSISIIGCSNSNNSTSETTTSSKPEVIASSSILCDLTQQIAQDTVNLTCLMEPEQDPHTYKITPGDRQAMETADLIIYGGYKLVPSIEDAVTAIENPVTKIAVYEQAVPNPILAEHHHHEDEDHDEHEHEHEHEHAEEEKKAEVEEELEPDPHVWHSVQNAIAIAEEIEGQLAKINPDQAEIYAENSKQFQDELGQLDAWIKQQIATIPTGQKTLVTTHDSFNYYIQAYGLENQESLQGLSTAEQPTASRLKELVTELKSTKVPTIFAEVTTNDRLIGTVAREASVQISPQKLFTGALGTQGSEADTYIGMIAANTCTIVNGLGGECVEFNK